MVSGPFFFPWSDFEMLIWISKQLDRVIIRFGQIAAWLVLPLIGVTVFDVVTRRFFVLGSTRLQEMEWHFHAALLMLCLGYGYLKDVHVRVELVRERRGSRLKAWIELVGCVLFLLPYTFLILYTGFDFVEVSFLQDEVSPSMSGLPYRWAIKSTVIIGFLLVGAAGFSVLIRQVLCLSKKGKS